MSEYILIQPVNLGLGLGEASKIKIQVTYTIGSVDVVLQVFFYNEANYQLAASPLLLGVPQDVLTSWNLNFGALKTWTLEQIGANTL